MSFEEEFDDIIKQKSDELNYPFDENNWDKASAMIDAQRKTAVPGNLKRFLAPALILLIVASAVVVGVNYTLQPAQNTAIALTQTNKNNAKPSTESNTAGPDNADNAQHLAATTINTDPVTQASSQSIASPQSVSTAAPADNSHTPASLKKSTTQQADKIAPEQITTAIPANAPDKVKPVPAVPVVKAGRDKAVQNDNDPLAAAVANPIAKNENAKSNTTSNSNVGGLNSNMVDAAANTGAVNDNSADTGINTPLAQNKASEPGFEYLPLIPVAQPGQPEPDLTELPQPTALNYLKKYDEDYYKNGAKSKTHFANIEAGGTYMLGWDAKNGKDGKGLNWFGGFNYGVYITKKISISAGIQGYNIHNISQAFYTSKKLEYGFGSTASNTLITSNNLYYAAVPLKIYYAVNKESQLGVGVNFGYLVNSKNTVETYDVQDNARINYKAVKNNGVYNGTNSLNMMLGASYRVQVKPRFYLTGEFVYGISDIFKNTKTIKNNEKPSGIWLSLQYTLFDK